MNESKKNSSTISKASSYEEIGVYWDSQSLADHWDETSDADFEVTARKSLRVAIRPEVYEQIEVEAQSRGVVPEKLANILLSERLAELADG